jgi:hypothetical protein
MLPYSYIIYIGSLVLLVRYLFTEAPIWAKSAVGAIMIFCLTGGLGMFHLGLARIFLPLGLSVGIALYLACLKARG